MAALVACRATAGPGSSTGADAPDSGSEFGAPDAPVVGAQGDRGQFTVDCAFDRLLGDDPIVKPGQPGAAHLHAFFGAVDVTADTTYDELVSGLTTCDQQLDTASYWAPVLIDRRGEPVSPSRSVAYYRVAAGVRPEAVEPFPASLTMVAGDAAADAPQPISAVSWSCGVSPHLSSAPPDCRPTGSLRMSVTFQDCWNGSEVSSPEPALPSSHVAYSHDGRCPTGFGVHIPQLQFVVEYPALDPAGLTLSSGSLYSGHADFWNAWRQDKLEREVEHCLRRDLACRISRSNRSFG